MYEKNNFKFEPKRFENKKDDKVTYKQYYMKGNKPNCYGMSKFTYRVLMTLIWLAFTFGLIVVFNNAAPLWLLILWLIAIA